MQIKRTNRLTQRKFLSENKNLKILDLGCSLVNYWKEANHFADIDDHGEEFKKRNLNYTKIEPNKKLPFKDKEFDYIIASHVVEHVEDISYFLNELSRIGKRGYIEVPTPLWDNLVDGPHFVKYGHKWWVTFDDNENKIIINKKINIVNRFLSIEEHNKHMMWFRDSIVTQLY